MAHVSKYSHQCTHFLKYYFETLFFFAIIKDFRLCSGSEVIVILVHLLGAHWPVNAQTHRAD